MRPNILIPMPDQLSAGFALGPSMEERFRRTLMPSPGDLLRFVLRPVSGTATALIPVVALAAAWRPWRGAPPLAVGGEG